MLLRRDHRDRIVCDSFSSVSHTNGRCRSRDFSPRRERRCSPSRDKWRCSCRVSSLACRSPRSFDRHSQPRACFRDDEGGFRVSFPCGEDEGKSPTRTLIPRLSASRNPKLDLYTATPPVPTSAPHQVTTEKSKQQNHLYCFSSFHALLLLLRN